MKKIKENNEEKEILYILIDWSEENVLLSSYDKRKIVMRVGEDNLAGEWTDSYQIIEIDLDEVEE
ncbi:hypothetical protein [uncultured Finegoldia sp.]|uniref:hypothetical protein n=1 Tax=uncultured Finegoldia sp. TaxID=328009 RepID=UPI00280582F5|nr:hypothetical protein [uncultured Finegoldia sp.]MDU1409798.1 hypothetical protein [Veillonella sp.]